MEDAKQGVVEWFQGLADAFKGVGGARFVVYRPELRTSFYVKGVCTCLEFSGAGVLHAQCCLCAQMWHVAT